MTPQVKNTWTDFGPMPENHIVAYSGGTEKALRSLLLSALCKCFFRSGLLGAASLLFYSISLDFAILLFLSKMLALC